MNHQLRWWVPIACGLLRAEPFISSLASGLPTCAFRSITGWLCPACGNTHSVLALLRLDFPAALRASVVPPLLVAFLVAFYLESVLRAFHRPARLIPRNLPFYLVLIALLVVYWIGRNIPAVPL